jgi:3-hydroxybutyryl-CoA dehydrogenase
MVVGAGTMGVGIAQNFAQAGLTVKLVDISQEILSKSMAQIRANLSLFQEYGLIHEDPPAIMSRLSPVLTKALSQAMKNCDYIVESIPEILEAKKDIFAQLDKCPPNVILSSNTGSFTVTELTRGLKTPGRVVGLHYFNPPHIIPAVEIHRSRETTDEAVEITRELMLRIGKKPVLVRKEVPGFIINRITGAMEREIDYLLDEGVVTPEELDTAIKSSIGFRFACLGPQEIEDMIGIDTVLRVSARLFKVLSNATESSPQLAEKAKKGELGIKSGKGWYDYSGKSQAEVLEEKNRKLLRQLALFYAADKEVIVDKR